MSNDEVKAKRIAALAKAREAKKAKKAEEKAFVKLTSIDNVPAEGEAALMAEIANLRKQLQEAKEARSDGENAALSTAQAQSMLMQRQIEEVPTGRTVSLPRLKHYKVVGHKDDGREILKPIFHNVDVPTYFYKIDMPGCGGVDIKINGESYYHGAVYELDIDTLRSVKDQVYRLWKHDAEIHGSDENFYRKPERRQISARGMV
jgi:hypothetical protein